MKKMLLALLGASLLACGSMAGAESENVRIIVNGEELSFSGQKPVIRNDSVLIPFRSLFESLGAFVDWIPESRTILGSRDLNIIELFPQEAEAILTAAELENVGAVIYSFTMQSDGSLFSGADAGPVLRELEKAGACAVGFNCVPADGMTEALVTRLRRYTQLPLICKPNAGMPVINPQGIAEYDLPADKFAQIMMDCRRAGALLLGGCCGTTPEHIRQMVDLYKIL